MDNYGSPNYLDILLELFSFVSSTRGTIMNIQEKTVNLKLILNDLFQTNAIPYAILNSPDVEGL